MKQLYRQWQNLAKQTNSNLWQNKLIECWTERGLMTNLRSSSTVLIIGTQSFPVSVLTTSHWDCHVSSPKFVNASRINVFCMYVEFLMDLLYLVVGLVQPQRVPPHHFCILTYNLTYSSPAHVFILLLPE